MIPVYLSKHNQTAVCPFTNGLIDALGTERGLFWRGFPCSDSFTQPDTAEQRLWP